MSITMLPDTGPRANIHSRGWFLRRDAGVDGCPDTGHRRPTKHSRAGITAAKNEDNRILTMPFIISHRENLTKRILCITLQIMKWTKIVFVSTLCFAVVCNNARAAQRCNDALYRQLNPGKCPKKSSDNAVGLKLAGGVFATLGGALAIISLSGDAHGGTAHYKGDQPMPRDGYPVPKLGTARDDVLRDWDEDLFSQILSDAQYRRNARQYDEIGVAFSRGRGYTGAGATVAILDTGDKYWHGRAVADIIGSVIAPDAKLEKWQITRNSYTFLEYDAIGETVRAAAQNATVINNSWNISMSASELTSREQIARLTDAGFIDAISDAARDGTIFVWAAGNNGAAQSGALAALPAVMPELHGRFINVVAWDSETGALADYSNACGLTKMWCITAPGSGLSADRYIVDGTSFAAPMVSAAIAVLQEAFPFLSPEQITELIFITATDLGAPGVDEIYGWGMLDLERASRPVGTAHIAGADGGVRPLSTAHINGTIAKRIDAADLKFAFFDAFGRPFQANLADNVSVRNRAIGFLRLRGERETAVNLGNIAVGFMADDFIAGDGFLQTDGKNITTFVAANHSTNIAGITLFQRARIGTATPHPAPDSIIGEFSRIYTVDAAVGAQYGDIRLSVGTPETIVGGDMTLRLATGRATDGTLIYQNHRISLAAAPAVEYSVGYKFLTLGFVDNPVGTDEFYIVAKSKIRF